MMSKYNAHGSNNYIRRENDLNMPYISSLHLPLCFQNGHCKHKYVLGNIIIKQGRFFICFVSLYSLCAECWINPDPQLHSKIYHPINYVYEFGSGRGHSQNSCDFLVGCYVLLVVYCNCCLAVVQVSLVFSDSCQYPIDGSSVP